MRRIFMLAALAAALSSGTADAQVTYAYPAPVPAYTADSPATFMALVNQARAQIGRPALVWDATLAAYAATNAGIHMPGSSGGASQCWAGVRSYYQAFHMWRNSPAHWNILMGASSSIGVAPCPTGMTANCR
jgi:uncharacterized protein YkwD